MQIPVHFWSYFAELAGVSRAELVVGDTATVGDALAEVAVRFPKWAAVRQCSLVAVGVEYAEPRQALRPGDELSLFPPVQGG